MRLLLPLLVWLGALLPGDLHAFYDVYELKADAIRKDPSIKIRISRSGDQVRFTVALKKLEDPKLFWHGELYLVDEKGVELAKIGMRGEDIHRAVLFEALQQWNWKDFTPAEVFIFTVDSKLLSHSTFWWEIGLRADERGMPNIAGSLRYCSLSALVGAAEQQNMTDHRVAKAVTDDVEVISRASLAQFLNQIVPKQLTVSSRSVLLKTRLPIGSGKQILPEIQKVAERPIVAMTEDEHWIWFATDVVRDSETKTIRGFIGGYVARKGGYEVIKWSFW